jgi:AcrR family transcriptional regulator
VTDQSVKKQTEVIHQVPRSKAQNEQIRAVRRRAILEAAIPLFAQNGFSQTSVSDVARAAGVSHGLVFRHFPTKEALFRAAILEPLVDSEQTYLRFTLSVGTPLQRIRVLVREHVSLFSRQESYLRLTQYVIGLRERFPDLAAELFGFARRWIESLVPIICDGQQLGELAPGDPHGIAASYFSYLFGVALTLLEPPDSGFWEEIINNGIRIFGPLKTGEEESVRGSSLPG